ncbi:DUF5709 domain-containing protein [Cellulomonas cellasea]|uniref:DUF5709 domain-containing protein n=1 Tax=Cellulomonas cellasea TaxID=43670 RepID=UPI0025A385F0|nr:DUF5709 domain-containing protein [Cellulomonas cellasea]MDM8085694.1 DUF5709 domain-containing protein [Cellulomonas cellasea]
MSDETPGTRPDPETFTEGDSDQLPKEDMLEERGVDDLLDEAWYTAPERPPHNRFGETPWEEAHGETLDERLAEEEPEVWDTPGPRVDPAREPGRAGRLVEDDQAVEAGVNDQFAIDEGVAGGAASAEEAAVHVIEDVEEAPPGPAPTSHDESQTGNAP